MGYHVTEACVLTDSNHPTSIYSRIHSSHEKGFASVNHITFEAIDRSVKLLKNAIFVMDGGHDDNIYTIVFRIVPLYSQPGAKTKCLCSWLVCLF